MRKRLFVPERSDSGTFFAFHQLRAFARFEQFPEMLLFSAVQSHPILVQDALDFFCHRFPPFVIAFYNTPEQKLYVQSKRKDFQFKRTLDFDSSGRALDWLRPVVQGHVKQRMEFSVEWKPEFYEKFFESQFVESRRNPRLQRQMMRPFLLPKNSIEYKSMKKNSRNLPNTRLGEFFFDKTPTENPVCSIPVKSGFRPKNAE